MTDVFAALADPTRRHLLEALAARESSATELASGLPVTRQAVAKHLAALREAGLVTPRRSGSVNADQTSSTGASSTTSRVTSTTASSVVQPLGCV